MSATARRALIGATAGVVATPVAALVAVRGRWTAGRAGATALVLGLWAMGYRAVLLRPWPPLLYIAALLVWCAAGGATIALASASSEERPAGPRPPDGATIFFAALLAYAAAAVVGAGVSMIYRIGQPEATSLFGGEIFLWAAPALVIGGAAGAIGSRRFGPASGRVAVSALASGIGIYAASVAVTLIAMASAASWGYSLSAFVDVRWGAVQWLQAAAGTAVLGAASAWAASAPSSGRVALRCLLGIAVMCAHEIHSMALLGLQEGWHVRAASELMAQAAPEARWKGIERLKTALASRPNAPDRAYLLWACGAEAAFENRIREAEECFRAEAALPEDVLGQEFVRRSKSVLQDHARPLTGPSREAAGSLAVENRGYLDSDWRAVIGLWRAALPKEKPSDFQARLQKLSLSDRRIKLPRLRGWAELAAWTELQAAPIALGSLDSEGVRRTLDAGSPVLIRKNSRFLLVTGHVPAFRAFRFLEYKEEPPWLAAQLAREEAASAFASDDAARIARLSRLQASISDLMPEEELARALSDSRGLCAWIGKSDAPSAATREWLLGEAALEAEDPLMALRRYENSWKAAKDPALLPYVRAAAMELERDRLDIRERRVNANPSAEAFAEWSRAPARRGWLELAAKAAAAADPVSLPAPVLQRLASTLDRRDPKERARLAAFAEELARRQLDDAEAIGNVAELRRSAGDERGWRTAALQLRSLNPEEGNPLLDAVEASLALTDLASAADLLARANPFNTRTRGRRLALSGRLELLRSHPRKALSLLEAAADAEHNTPEIHRDLALALDALGKRSDADRHWRWVAQTGVLPDDLDLAKRRLEAAR